MHRVTAGNADGSRQMGGLGPMMGQANHFRRYAKEKIEYAIERYTNEANRLTNVLDKRLGESRYVACDEYTIADIAIFPWMRGADAARRRHRRSIRT